jgi:glycosyltransferase involved in cell wall biosynthesis
MDPSPDFTEPPTDSPDVSLVIPVHNGAGFITETVTSARDFLTDNCRNFEILVVDDGSSDRTAVEIQGIPGNGVRLLRLSSNLGKFAALKHGMTEAKGSCRVFTDADLPYDLEAVPYIAHLVNERGHHLVVGDRTLRESTSLTDERVTRQLSSRVFSFCVRMAVTGGLFDTQCGIKGFSGEVADALFPLLTDNSFSGDVELLYIALKHNLSIRRIPVRLQRSSPSTVRLRFHSLPMLARILRLRHNWTSGRYVSDQLDRLASQAYWRRPERDDG